MAFPFVPYLMLPGHVVCDSESPPAPDPTDIFQHSPADIVRQLLLDLELVNDTTWPSTVNSEPSDGDDHVTVYDISGRQEGSFQVDGQVQTQHGVQVRVRSSTHPTSGWLKADTIAKMLDQTVLNRVVFIDSNQYIVYDLARVTPVLSIGKDSPSSKRNIYTITYHVAVRPLEV